MTQSETTPSVLDYTTERPKAQPGKRILLAFFIDDSLVTGTQLTQDVSISYNMDPVYVYSENWVVRQVISWQNSQDNQYILQEGYGEAIEKRDNYHRMMISAIRSCRATGATDIWVSICGPQISYNATTGDTLVESAIDMLGYHMRSIEPDLVVFVNQDVQFIKGTGVTYPSLSGEGLGITVNNDLNVSGSMIEVTNQNRWNSINTLFDEVGAMLIVPALLHSQVRWRSQFKPTPFDINNDGLVDGTDLYMLLEVDADVLIDTITNDSDYLKYESWYAYLVYGDLLLSEESDSTVFEYIHCAPAVGGLFATLEDEHGFKPLIGKHLNHLDVWKPMLEEDIDTLRDYRINPIRRTIRNGITPAGNYTFFGNSVTDVYHPSYPLTRAHNVFLANTICKEMEFKLRPYEGKTRKEVKTALPSIIQSVMNTKPIIEHSYDVVDVSIDEIQVIIIIRVLNTVNTITTTTTVSKVK